MSHYFRFVFARTAFIHHIAKRDAVEIIGNNGLQAFPNVERNAFTCALAGVMLGFEAYYRGKVSFCEAQNFANGDIFGVLRKPITALEASCCNKNFSFVENGYYLLEIFF